MAVTYHHSRHKPIEEDNLHTANVHCYLHVIGVVVEGLLFVVEHNLAVKGVLANNTQNLRRARILICDLLGG